jgi:hypothetical protein
MTKLVITATTISTATLPTIPSTTAISFNVARNDDKIE